jgi:hypothetical protein
MTAKIADRIAEAVQAERDRIAALAIRLNVHWVDHDPDHEAERSFAYRIEHPEEFGDT